MACEDTSPDPSCPQCGTPLARPGMALCCFLLETADGRRWVPLDDVLRAVGTALDYFQLPAQTRALIHALVHALFCWERRHGRTLEKSERPRWLLEQIFRGDPAFLGGRW